MKNIAINLYIVFGFRIFETFGLHSTCKEYFEGFSLPDDYNYNVPSKDKNTDVMVNNVIQVNELLEV